MKPTERRLLRELPRTRRYVALTILLGAAVAAAVIGQASLLAWILARGFETHASPARLAIPLAALAGVVTARAALEWTRGVVARDAASATKNRLRARILARTQELGPARLAHWRDGEVATLVTRGLDELDPYFTSYLPRLVSAAILPLAVIIWLGLADWSSALIILVTLPLIPIFAALIGAHTRDHAARQWYQLSRLGGHFLDVVTGLSTLRAYGRAKTQVGVVHRVADAYRSATMRTLRVAFLSSMVLELVATLSVALVAVPVGLRLMAGGVDLRTALLVLFLAPEAYLPLRAAGGAFHDSMRGIAVAKRAFAVLDLDIDAPVETTPAQRSTPHQGRHAATAEGTEPDAGTGIVRFEDVTVRYPGRDTPALDRVSLRIDPGERVAVLGPSGAGKSTLLALLLGFVRPESGRVLVGDVDLACLDADGWRAFRHRLAWVPGRPHLFAGTVADNIRLGDPDAATERVREAARAAAADDFISALSYGYDTLLGERGAGLSTGQRQRVALARAYLLAAPLMLLDEPTAHLDPRGETVVTGATARLMRGRTALLVTHRPALLPYADRVVRLRHGRASADAPVPPVGTPAGAIAPSGDPSCGHNTSAGPLELPLLPTR